MFLTRKHLSRRTVLKGAGATIALPLLDAMIPSATRARADGRRGRAAPGLRLLPARRAAGSVAAGAGGTRLRVPVHPEAARTAARLRDGGQRPAQQGAAKLEPARHHRRDVAQLREPAPAQREDRASASRPTRSPHGTSDSDTPLSVARTLRRARRHDLVPHAGAAAADGEQPAQGVLTACSARAITTAERQAHPGDHGQPPRLRARGHGQR